MLSVPPSSSPLLEMDPALTNAVLNGFPDAQGIYLDWHHPPDSQFPLILGCEVIYEQGNHGPILDVLDHMLAYDWPGNIRELENIIKRLVILGNQQQIIDELTVTRKA